MKHKLWINGQWIDSAITREIRSPYSGQKVAETCYANAENMKNALQAAFDSRQAYKKTSRYLRSCLLSVMAREIEARRTEFVTSLINEAGKPKTISNAEINRAILTFTLAAEEAKRFGGEIIPIDTDGVGRAYLPAQSFWTPRGVILAITPFNFPLNLAAHKVAPALAVGAPIILKPPPQAPGGAILLAEIFEKAVKEVSDQVEKIPTAAFQVISADNDVAALAVKDPRVSVLSFTGSDRVGWMLQGQAIGKKVVLELGGNAGVIIHEDADFARAAARCAFGGFAYAGQTCISVQRIYVHEKVFQKFQIALLDEVAKIKIGDPNDAEVTVGPLIDEKAANRVMSWVDEAVKDGAKVLAGGTRKNNVIAPTVVSNVGEKQKLICEEVFGPVVALQPYKEFEEALALVNSSRFGLQAGVFTDSEKLIQKSLETLEVGGILINEVPTYRADAMPYGGVKDSGLGREGLRYAMEDYCERRTLIKWRG